ncbi:hypothetical protein [Thioalkalivibrio sp. ALJ1]|uniref:hypothetical protein n=1 Tax=Thioalkalivibrio sp. ALJ1 TaxID=1158144 RepID=UPI000570DB1D|nr:hypothetical protein [Thioalkalivibrio sp. ALJ1]
MQQDTPFLRSINIVFDATEPERIGHYEPTSKAIAFLRGVSGITRERAFFVIAPYGTGKSVSASYLLQLVENRKDAKATLENIGERLRRVEPEFGEFAQERLAQSEVHGIAVALEGSIRDIGHAVQNAAIASLNRIGMQGRASQLERMEAKGISGALAVLDYLKDNCTPSKSEPRQIDRVVLIWDEFGRHVEQLVRSNQPQRLAEIQTLAEYATRTQKLPITLGLLMHQGLLQYASGLSQSMLAEWRKVEGRFDPIQYVDDSKELYRLISKIVAAHKQETRSADTLDARIAESAIKVGLFTELEGELSELLEHASPLHPAALYILPRLAARAAQHERTLFGFVMSADLRETITPEHLYDYFAPAMQADTGAGGTYRKWLETESAISKVDDTLEARALKTASILELGLSGERSRVSRSLLEFSLGGNADATRAINHLLERKLLLHRRRTDQISLWHGTDVDLRARLENELARLEGDFDTLALLNKEFRPSVWRPVRYNDTYKIRRYFECEFVTVNDISAKRRSNEQQHGHADGRILYVVPQTESDCTAARGSAKQHPDPLTVIVAPGEMLDIRSAAAELICLTRMQQDETLLAEDPLIQKELQQMLDETQAHLHNQLARLTQPSSETDWFSGGRRLEVTDRATLLTALSIICEEVFPRTPVINNEMIVRHKPSAQIVNARRKVVMGILEQHGHARLGIEGEFADASVFRTVLLNTGLYAPAREEELSYDYVQPESIADPRLAEVWLKFKALLTTPDECPKDLTGFFTELKTPPYGIRGGVLPVLFAAALKAFPSARAISDQRGEYLDDLLPSDIESICQQPSAYVLSVMKLDAATRDYLVKLGSIFGVNASRSSDPLRAVYDGLEAWRARLPPGALDTSEVPPDVRQLQQTLSRDLSPVQLFFRRLPELADVPGSDIEGILRWTTSATRSLAGVVDTYRNGVLTAVHENLRLLAHTDSSGTTMARFDGWRRTLPPHVEDQVSGIAKAVLALPLKRFPDDHAFADALAAIVAERIPQRWTDSDLVRFRNRFADLVAQIETRALAPDAHQISTKGTRAAVADLYSHRIETLVTNLATVIGGRDANAKLRNLITRLEEAENGDSP